MGEEAFQAEGRRVEALRAGDGPSQGGGAGIPGWAWTARVERARGLGGGLAVIPARAGGHLGEVVGVQEGLRAEPRCGNRSALRDGSPG